MLRSCWSCHWSGLPRRQVCPRCGDTHWLTVHTATGIVAASTLVLRNFGADLSGGEYLVSIRLDNGGTVIARAHDAAELPVGSRAFVNSSLRANRA